MYGENIYTPTIMKTYKAVLQCYINLNHFIVRMHACRFVCFVMCTRVYTCICNCVCVCARARVCAYTCVSARHN